MQQVILLNGNIILRETSRSTDRVGNRMGLTIRMEPVFGVTYTSAIQDVLSSAFFEISKENEPVLWNQMKDATQQEMVALIFGYLMGTDLLYLAFKAHTDYMKDPTYILEDPVDAQGNPIPGGNKVKRLVPSGYEAKIKKSQDDRFQGPNLFVFQMLYDRGVETIVLQEVSNV